MDRDQALFRLYGKYAPEGTILFKKGEPGEEMFLIQSGSIRVTEVRAGGREAKLPTTGDVLGEEAFFNRTLRTLRAEVVRDARLIQVNERNLEAVVRHGPEATLGMIEKLFELAAGARRDLDAWTMNYALRRAEPYLRQIAAGGIRSPDLAEQAGIDEADAQRLLNELERRGGLARAGETFNITDPGLFARAAQDLAAAGSTT